MNKSDFSLRQIKNVLGGNQVSFNGPIKHESSRQAVMRGALALYGSKQDKAAAELIALLENDDIFDKALCEVVAQRFHFPSYSLT